MKEKNQTWIYDPTLQQKKVLVVWCGWFGSTSAYYIAQMWVTDITLVDFDDVEEHNTASQFYKTTQLGMDKPTALASNIYEFTGIEPTVIIWKFSIDMLENEYDIVISAVDNMDVRKEIVDACYDAGVECFIEARMSWEWFTIYSLDPLSSREDWMSFRYPQSEADPEICTMKSISYNTWVIGWMIAKIVRNVIVGDDYPFCIIWDLSQFTIKA